MRATLCIILAIGVIGVSATACVTDRDGDGIAASVDCDDGDPELGQGTLWYRDADGDGYGDDALWTLACTAPEGYAAVAGDCGTTDPETFPGAQECWYDGWDQNCDGGDDYDMDGDGHSSDDYGGEDCDDNDPEIHPGAADAPWDGVDADCSGGSDDDWDGDGFDAETRGGDDCDDLDPDVNPDAVEGWYDGVDQDCDGASDYDQDGDGSDSDAEHGGGDCDDLDSDVRPGAAEIWYDGVDQDCDGASDYDQDGDGYDSQDYGGADCQDGEADIHPGQFEWNDGDDNDCDGHNDVRYLDSADWVLQGERVGDAAGSTVAPAGDVDGDGLQDVLVGAPGWGEDSGAAYVLLGASVPSEPGVMSLWRADGRIVGASPGDTLGAALCSLGDADGDGYGDLLLASPGAGLAYLLPGPVLGDASVADAQAFIGSGQAEDELGSAVAAGGDLNSDGAVDLALGAPAADASRGAVLVFDAGLAGVVLEDEAYAEIEGGSDDERVGAAVAMVGDLDGDGVDELLVGAPGQSGHGSAAGAAYLFHGPLSGTLRVDSADASLMGANAGDAAGSAVAAAGDTDADGYADFLVGAPHSDMSADEGGAAYLFLGPLTASALELAHADATFSGDLDGIRVGSTAAGGDVDGDGHDDVLVGAPGADLAATDNGVGYLILGPFAGSLCTCGSDAKLYGNDSDDRAGTAVALPGDVDGDGFGELLLGVPGADAGVGAASLVFGAER